jgi:DNA-binding response OmpR family regulator
VKPVLPADDDPDVLPGLREHLESPGDRLTAVSNGREAVEQAQRGDYSVALMCSGLVSDGVEVLRMLRRSKLTLPALLMTSTDAVRHIAMPVDQVQGRPRHPIDRDKLAELVERLLWERG